MEITLYLDVVFAVNFSVDLLLLLMLRRVLKLNGRWVRLAAGSAAGAIFSALFLWLYLWLTAVRAAGGPVPVLLRAGGALLCGMMMIRIAFSLRKGQGKKVMAGLFLAAAAAEGTAAWVQGSISAAMGEEASVLSMGSAPLFLVLAAGCLAAEGLMEMLHEAREMEECCFRVKLYYQGRTAAADGFLDTGNRMKDPVSGRPVHVADRKLLETLCPRPEGITMIPCRTIKGSTLLAAVTLDRIEVIQGKRILVWDRPLVAASPGDLNLQNGCRILLHASFFRIWRTRSAQGQGEEQEESMQK